MNRTTLFAIIMLSGDGLAWSEAELRPPLSSELAELRKLVAAPLADLLQIFLEESDILLRLNHQIYCLPHSATLPIATDGNNILNHRCPLIVLEHAIALAVITRNQLL